MPVATLGMEGREMGANAVKFPRVKAAECSTAHVSLDDSELLDRYARDIGRSELARKAPIRVADTGYGWAVFLMTDAEMALTVKEEILADGASEAMAALFIAAAKRGFAVLILDRDADEVEGLPTFE